MNAKVNAKGEDLFKNKKAIEYYNAIAKDPACYQAGQDYNGKIYFAYANGCITRITRAAFIREANEIQ